MNSRPVYIQEILVLSLQGNSRFSRLLDSSGKEFELDFISKIDILQNIIKEVDVNEECMEWAWTGYEEKWQYNTEEKLFQEENKQ